MGFVFYANRLFTNIHRNRKMTGKSNLRMTLDHTEQRPVNPISTSSMQSQFARTDSHSPGERYIVGGLVVPALPSRKSSDEPVQRPPGSMSDGDFCDFRGVADCRCELRVRRYMTPTLPVWRAPMSWSPEAQCSPWQCPDSWPCQPHLPAPSLRQHQEHAEVDAPYKVLSP